VEDSEDLFLNALKGVEEPEAKRKVIGNKFIDVFQDSLHKHGGDKIKYLLQGTL